MLIANPIYDAVFKFLLEDIDIAKRFISAIIGEEIVELELKPQEQTTKSAKYLLTVFRLDFKAVVKSANGERKKILIELQKSNNGFDIMRFKHYLGSNYSKTETIDGITTPLPILPIYVLGFKLSIERPVLKIGRQYQDISTGEILHRKDNFIEQLSHDCFVVQVPCLPKLAQTKLEKVLSFFNQKWIFDGQNRWLMRYNQPPDDEDQTLIMRRLAMAAESEDVQESIRAEENFEASLDEAFRQKELIIEQKEIALAEEKQRAEEEKQRADIEKQRADTEKQRAEEEKQRADIEKQRADATDTKNEELLRRIIELEQLMKR